jgi:hypothetical protein
LEIDARVTNLIYSPKALSGMFFTKESVAKVSEASPRSEITASANFIFKERGAVGIPALAGTHSLGLRQFERRFGREIGVLPKPFAPHRALSICFGR